MRHASVTKEEPGAVDSQENKKLNLKEVKTSHPWDNLEEALFVEKVEKKMGQKEIPS